MSDVKPSWWQAQRGFLLGALVLGFLALYLPYRAEWRNWARSHPTVAQGVGKGAQAGYLGARWRLLNLTERDSTRLEANQMLLVARFEMIRDAGTDPDSLSLCEATLVDPRGRRWTSNTAPPLAARSTLPTLCGYALKNGEKVFPAAGQPWLFEKNFLVPRGLDARALDVEIFVIPVVEPKQPGLFLRFTQ